MNIAIHGPDCPQPGQVTSRASAFMRLISTLARLLSLSSSLNLLIIRLHPFPQFLLVLLFQFSLGFIIECRAGLSVIPLSHFRSEFDLIGLAASWTFVVICHAPPSFSTYLMEEAPPSSDQNQPCNLTMATNLAICKVDIL